MSDAIATVVKRLADLCTAANLNGKHAVVVEVADIRAVLRRLIILQIVEPNDDHDQQRSGDR